LTAVELVGVKEKGRRWWLMTLGLWSGFYRPAEGGISERRVRGMSLAGEEGEIGHVGVSPHATGEVAHREWSGQRGTG
jgi:hypothetical protein